MRSDGRRPNELRPITIVPGYQEFAPGSALIRWGKTWVLCTASVEESVPPFRMATGGGWLTAEYNMLPGSTPGGRKSRRTGGRDQEIQRLIGRSLRAAVDLDELGQRTITVDCDVIQADGGTRVASITGGFVAAALAIEKLQRSQQIHGRPIKRQIAAVSLGILKGQVVIDLPYEEDSRAEVDLNMVMTSTGDIIEIQGTAEGAPFNTEQLNAMCELGKGQLKIICDTQTAAIEAKRQG